MATVAGHSGFRRLAASSAITIHAAAEAGPAAAALQLKAGAANATLASGFLYASRVDQLSPDVLLRGVASSYGGTPSLGTQAADLKTNVLVHLRGAASSGRDTPTIYQQVKKDTPHFLASSWGASPLLRRRTPLPPGNHRSFSSDASGNAKPELCNCDGEAMMKTLGQIETKLDVISDKLSEIHGKVERNTKDYSKLENDLKVLNEKGKGSGDWTSFKIKGKTINWLSVCSAVWEAVKAFHK